MTIQSRRLRALAASCVLAWSGLAAAQPGRTAGTDPAIPVDLPAAIRLALAQPAVRAAAHELAASQAQAGQAGSLPNPELEVLREGQQAGYRTTTIQLRQPIELGGKRQARIDVANGAAALAQAELARTRRALHADTVAAFYAVLVAEDRQRLAQDSTDLARRSVEVAAKRVQAGRISPLDETRARLAAVDAAGDARRAAAALAIARTRLGALLGRPGESLVLSGTAGALPELEPLAVLLGAAGEGAAVRQARLKLAAQEAQVRAERAARVPDLALTLGRQREEDSGDARRSQTVIGLSVPLPLFQRNEGNLLAALRRADKAREEVCAAETASAAALASAHARYEQASLEARLLAAEVVPQAQSAHALTLTGFEYGKFSLLDVLDAQRTLFQVRARQCDALLEAWKAWADIEGLRAAPTDTESNP